MRSVLSRLPLWLGGAIPIGLMLFALIGLLLWVGGAVGLRWDPFGIDRRRLETAQARIDRAESDAAARHAEISGEREQARRLEQAQKPVRAADALTSVAIHEARTADDAQIPLAPDRADRLRAHDGELCRLASELAGCASAPGPA